MRINLIIIILSILYSCSNNAQNIINIEQIDSNYPIIIRSNNENTFVDLIKFPLVFEINKSSLLKKITLSIPDYYYYYIFTSNKEELKYWNSNVNIYIPHKDKLERYDYTYKIFLGKLKQEYVFYTGHYMIDTTKIIQKLFTPYIAKMKILGKDTMHIGSIQELKRTNPELLNTFLKGDSIELHFEGDEGFHHIKLPVEIR